MRFSMARPLHRLLPARSLLPVLALIATLPACTVARMQLDPQLDGNAPAQQVSGMGLMQFRKPVVFGAYQAKITRGGMKTTTSTRLGPYQSAASQQDFDFAMTAPASWTGTCTYGTSKRSALYPINNDAGLVCTLVPVGAPGWQISLASRGNVLGPNSLTGTLTDGKASYGVAMVHRLAGSHFASAEPVGYEIRDPAGLAVAAVQVFNPGFVWIDPRLPSDQQTALAAGVYALLFSASATRDINDP